MILRVSLVENKPALFDIVRRPASKSPNKQDIVKTWVPALYLKMTDKTRQNVDDSFSEDTFQLLLT